MGSGNLCGGDLNIDHLASWLSLPVGGCECEAVVCASVQGEGLVIGKKLPWLMENLSGEGLKEAPLLAELQTVQAYEPIRGGDQLGHQGNLDRNMNGNGDGITGFEINGGVVVHRLQKNSLRNKIWT